MDIRDFFKGIRRDFAEFIFGLIIGFIAFVLLTQIAISVIIFLGSMNLILTGMIFLKLLYQPKTQKMIQRKEEACPECGSKTKHRATCSIGKRKKEGK